MKDLRKFYVDGEWMAPDSSDEMALVNPATEKRIGTITLGSVEDINRAVSAATKAFVAYSQTSVAERLALLGKFVGIYNDRYDEMAQAITAEMGAPITMSRDAQADCGRGHTEGFMHALREQETREELYNGDTQLREPIG